MEFSFIEHRFLSNTFYQIVGKINFLVSEIELKPSKAKHRMRSKQAANGQKPDHSVMEQKGPTKREKGQQEETEKKEDE